ncbi:unnamed protein product [Candidula unifasciata]|uniref:Sec1 family domain-containing protein 2 n=1 Tax=Candidula unifasciata TaxID=100452 RepID=A0A8S4AA80_9EUPU|nr:unnamed protein product [Candidula unifasciata]
MHKSAWDITREWWEEVRLKVKHAIIYMDAKMAELLHWSGGIDILFSAGAVDVREFSSFEASEESQKKAVFIISSSLTDVTVEIIRDVVSRSHFQYVVVMTTVSPVLHPGVAFADSDTVFSQFEEKVSEWMGNMNYTSEVIHVPLFCAEVCPGFVIAPAFSSMFPLLQSDVKQIAYQYSSCHMETKKMAALEDLELLHLPDNLQVQIQLLASGLHAWLQGMDVREDIFSIGNTSRLVATELDSYPPARARRKTVQNRASLVLVDRTLDIASAVTHQFDTLMDRIRNTLPTLQGHNNDCQVDLLELSNVCSDSASRVVLPGSLAPTDFSRQSSHLLPLIAKKQKEALMDVNRKLVETASAEKLPLRLSARPGRITADQIDSTVALFKGKYPLMKKHLDTLQIALATSQSLKHPVSSCHDSAVVAEKNLIQAVADNDDATPSGVSILLRLIMQEVNKPRNERNLDLDDMLCLITYLYAVADGECGDEDETRQLQEQFISWIKQDSECLSPLVKQIVGDKVTESILSDQIESVWKRLEALGDTLASFQQFKCVLDPGDAMTPASTRGLLRQIVEKIVDPGKPELLDVEYKSGGLKDLLKSGFGFFKGSGKPRPGDAPLLILFVVGGITAGKVKQIRDVVDKAKPQFEVIIGSTRLSSIDATLGSLFIADNINVDVL